MTPSNNHAIGIRLAAVGVLVLSFDALLIRLTDSDPWTIAFWRGSLMATSLGILSVLRAKSDTLVLLRRHWQGGLLLATLYGVNGSLFVLSISYTSTANTVVILSSSTFFAAFFSWLFLRERVRFRTWIAIFVSVAGVVVVFAGSVSFTSLFGDAMALLVAFSMGIMLSLMRRFSQLPRMPIIAISGLVMMCLALPQSEPLSLAFNQWIWVALMGLIQIPLASMLIMNATRYLTSPEVSLFLLVETVCAPIWVWLVVQEPAPPMTLVGGGMILMAIVIHSLLALREEKTP